MLVAGLIGRQGGRSHQVEDLLLTYITMRGIPGSSAGKESACNAGDPGLIPGSGRSTGEGVGYPLLYSWASLVAQLVKKPPAVWETWVRSLGWEDPLEKGMATHSSILAWRGPWGRRVGHDRATFVFIHNYEPYKETARPPASSQRGSLSACLCPAVPSPLLSPYFCSALLYFLPLSFSFSSFWKLKEMSKWRKERSRCLKQKNPTSLGKERWGQQKLQGGPGVQAGRSE